MAKFVINRKTWRCGSNYYNNNHGKGSTALLNRDGFMCCLGQIALQLGCTEKDIYDKAVPDQIVKPVCVIQKNGSNTKLASKAMDINDDNIPNTVREKKLKSLFSKFKHQITFKGKY